MATRKAEFVVYNSHEMENFHEFGYVKEIQSVCILNESILVFTVRKMTRLFKPDFYRLNIEIKSVKTAKEFGIADFETLQESIDVGIGFIKKNFPYVTKDDELAE